MRKEIALLLLKWQLPNFILKLVNFKRRQDNFGNSSSMERLLIFDLNTSFLV